MVLLKKTREPERGFYIGGWCGLRHADGSKTKTSKSNLDSLRVRQEVSNDHVGELVDPQVIKQSQPLDLAVQVIADLDDGPGGFNQTSVSPVRFQLSYPQSNRQPGQYPRTHRHADSADD